MKASRRSKRMRQHHQRSKRNAALNMVSLMDIFTILVFFLLVNSSSAVQDLPNVKQVKLPESVAQQLPRENVVIVVSGQDIVVQGRKVADVAEVMATKGNEIASLKQALERVMAQKLVLTTDDKKPLPGEVTIMGDKQIPFNLLKKIMLTCTRANYLNISLAVMRKTEKG